MKNFWKNYKLTLLLLAGIIIGGIAGVVFGPEASVVKPFGDLFLNAMFVIIVPLVFFSIASAIANMNGMKRLGKIMASILAVFLFTATISAVLGIAGVSIMNPLDGTDVEALKQSMLATEPVETIEEVSLMDKLVQTVTVSDFSMLLSKSNILQLIVFSVLFGLATAASREKGAPVAALLTSATEVLMKMVKIIMYYAPIGLSSISRLIIHPLGAADPRRVRDGHSYCIWS